VLDELLPGGFEHNVQSLRVVEKLENDVRGLNLTFECGTAFHPTRKTEPPPRWKSLSLSLADRIAYINHDIDTRGARVVLQDRALAAGMRSSTWQSAGKRINNDDSRRGVAELRQTGCAHERTRLCAVRRASREFMFERVYRNPIAKSEEEKVQSG
jgi:dGTPase